MMNENIFQLESNIAKARTLHTDFYTIDGYFEQSKEKIFATAWHYLLAKEKIAQPGSCVPMRLFPGFLDEPLLITTDKLGVHRCLPNVCTHRGNILVQKQCIQNQIRCCYHGRIFGLDGGFQSMPEFDEVQQFPQPSDNLQNLPLAYWGPLVFFSLSNNQPFDHQFKAIQTRMSWLPMDQFKHRPEYDRTYTVNAHWALYCENYLEGFHIPFVHQELNTVLDFSSYITELLPNGVLQIGVAKKGQRVFELPETSPDYGKHIAAFYFWIYPNLMFNFYPWGLSLNIVEPVSSKVTKIRYEYYIWRPDLFDESDHLSLDKVEQEDESIVEAVQLGVLSRFYQQGRYSVTRENGVHYFHRLIAQSMLSHSEKS